MNLKDAFRYQNKLNELFCEACGYLNEKSNVTKTKQIYFRHKVNSDDEDLVIEEADKNEVSEHINELCEFTKLLLQERIGVSGAIRKAKNQLDVDIDSESSLNRDRRTLSAVFRRMYEIRPNEVFSENGGYGYKFNNDGEQVTYKCNSKTVTTINFDRNNIKKDYKSLSDEADEISNQIDSVIVNTRVDFEPKFDMNSTFVSLFNDYVDSNKSE